RHTRSKRDWSSDVCSSDLDIDAGALLQSREQLTPAIERDRGVKVTHTDLLVALTARVLKKHPKMNASWAGNGIRLNPNVNMSVRSEERRVGKECGSRWGAG